MLIEDMNMLLDRRTVISYFTNEPSLKEILTDEPVAVAKIRITKEGGLIIINWVKDYDSEAGGKTSAVTIDLKGTKTLEFFKELIKIHSVVVDGILLSTAIISFTFRYHHNEHQKVSELISRFGKELEGFSVPFMGPSSGIIDSLKEISFTVPLHYMEVISTVPPNIMSITKDNVIKTFGNNWLREVKYLLGEETHAVYYERNEVLREDLTTTEISKSEKIYETTFDNPIINFFFDECTRQSIAPLGMGQRLNGRTFTYYVIVPEFHLSGFTSIMLAAFQKMHEWKMNIQYSNEISSL
jgi:hypothetical protein